MTKKKPAGATPRRYDEAYKQEAVRLWQSSGRSAEHTARELGISAFNLYEWKQRADRLTRGSRSVRKQGGTASGERAAPKGAGADDRAARAS
jgi:transposase-like protein